MVEDTPTPITRFLLRQNVPFNEAALGSSSIAPQGQVCIRAKRLISSELILVSVARSDYKYFYPPPTPPEWDASPSQSYPQHYVHRYHLYAWVEGGTVRIKCLTQEHNAMSPARARTRTARSGDERTSPEVTAPPTLPLDSINCSDSAAFEFTLTLTFQVMRTARPWSVL